MNGYKNICPIPRTRSVGHSPPARIAPCAVKVNWGTIWCLHNMLALLWFPAAGLLIVAISAVLMGVAGEPQRGAELVLQPTQLNRRWAIGT